MCRPIGVFDSGVGGLSVLRHLRELLPDERFIYFADSAYMPYGCKPAGIVRERCQRIADYFVAHDAKALVVACNTATAVAVDHLRDRFDVPIVGMEPAIKPAVARSRTGVIGVLATTGTVNSGKFADLSRRYGHDAKLFVQPCPGLVEMIERGEVEGESLEALLHSFLDPMLGREMDTLVLGCTHYPFVLSAIRALVGDGVSILDTGEAVARQLRRQLHANEVLAGTGKAGEVRLLAGDKNSLPVLSMLWGEPVDTEVTKVP